MYFLVERCYRGWKGADVSMFDWFYIWNHRIRPIRETEVKSWWLHQVRLHSPQQRPLDHIALSTTSRDVPISILIDPITLSMEDKVESPYTLPSLSGNRESIWMSILIRPRCLCCLHSRRCPLRASWCQSRRDHYQRLCLRGIRRPYLRFLTTKMRLWMFRGGWCVSILLPVIWSLFQACLFWSYHSRSRNGRTAPPNMRVTDRDDGCCMRRRCLCRCCSSWRCRISRRWRHRRKGWGYLIQLCTLVRWGGVWGVWEGWEVCFFCLFSVLGDTSIFAVILFFILALVHMLIDDFFIGWRKPSPGSSMVLCAWAG